MPVQFAPLPRQIPIVIEPDLTGAVNLCALNKNRLSLNPLEILSSLHNMETPFKQFLMNREVQTYNELSSETTQKVMSFFLDKEYLYLASVLTSCGGNRHLDKQPIYQAIAQSLESFDHCQQEKEQLEGPNPSTSKIITSLVDKGEFKKALPLIPLTPYKEEREAFSVELARNLASRGDIDEAKSLIPQITDQESKDRVNLQIIRALTKIGRVKEAHNIISEIKTKAIQALARPNIIHILARAGLVEEAKTIFFQIFDKMEKTYAALPLLEALISANQLTTAIQVLSEISSSSHIKISSLSTSQTNNETTLLDIKKSLVEALVKADRVDEAIPICFQASWLERPIIAAPIIERLIDTGQTERVTKLCSDFGLQDMHSLVLIRNFVKKGDFKSAKSLFTSFNYVNERTSAALSIMEGLIKENHPLKAFEFLKKEHTKVKLDILYSVIKDLSVCLIKEGHMEKAKEVFSMFDWLKKTKSPLAISIIEDLIAGNYPLEALEFIKSSYFTDRPSGYNFTKAMLAGKLIEVKRFPEAADLLRGILIANAAPHFITKAWVKAGQFYEASKSLTNCLLNVDDQAPLIDITLDVVIGIILTLGDYARIDSVIAFITNEKLKTLVLDWVEKLPPLDETSDELKTDAVRDLVNEKLFNSAIVCASTIADLVLKEEAELTIATALTIQDRYDEAKKAFPDIPDELELALPGLTPIKVMISVGELDQAISMLPDSAPQKVLDPTKVMLVRALVQKDRIQEAEEIKAQILDLEYQQVAAQLISDRKDS